jgi:hypothetical protein
MGMEPVLKNSNRWELPVKPPVRRAVRLCRGRFRAVEFTPPPHESSSPAGSKVTGSARR